MIGQAARLTGDIEVDGTYMGGRRRNTGLKKGKALAGPDRGAVGKAIVTAVSRKTGEVVVKEIPDAGRETLQGFVDEVAQEGVAVYTDGHRSRAGLDKRGNRRHGTVQHSAGEYVNGRVGANRMESFWALLRRTVYGTWHHISRRHPGLHILEAAFRHNMGRLDAGGRMSGLFGGMVGQGLRHAELIAQVGKLDGNGRIWCG